VIQQLFVDGTADVPDVPNVPVVGEMPEQATLGATIAGLSPGVPSSVEPSGTPTPVDPGANPVIVEPAVVDVAMPGDPDAPEAQLVEIVGIEIDPPPSKVEFDPTVCGLVVAVLEQGAVLAVGLNPPESSSVAPSGILPPGSDGALESNEPSGDVIPIPGVAPIAGVVPLPGAMPTCAMPTSQWASITRAAPAIVRICRIEASVFVAVQKKRTVLLYRACAFIWIVCAGLRLDSADICSA
jgi:hypothetical protein